MKIKASLLVRMTNIKNAKVREYWQGSGSVVVKATFDSMFLMAILISKTFMEIGKPCEPAVLPLPMPAGI